MVKLIGKIVVDKYFSRKLSKSIVNLKQEKEFISLGFISQGMVASFRGWLHPLSSSYVSTIYSPSSSLIKFQPHRNRIVRNLWHQGCLPVTANRHRFIIKEVKIKCEPERRLSYPALQFPPARRTHRLINVINNNISASAVMTKLNSWTKAARHTLDLFSSAGYRSQLIS